MTPSWEAVSALASAVSAAVVVATVIVGLRQVRIAASQVEHLRRATQLQGTMAIFDEMLAPESMEARRWVRQQLALRMQDPVFRADVVSGILSDDTHPELPVARQMEKIATYVKHGLLESAIIFDYFWPAVAQWEMFEETGFVALYRARFGDGMWENFEAFYHEGRRWLQERPAGWDAARRPSPVPTTAAAKS